MSVYGADVGTIGARSIQPGRITGYRIDPRRQRAREKFSHRQFGLQFPITTRQRAVPVGVSCGGRHCISCGRNSGATASRLATSILRAIRARYSVPRPNNVFLANARWWLALWADCCGGAPDSSLIAFAPIADRFAIASA